MDLVSFADVECAEQTWSDWAAVEQVSFRVGFVFMMRSLCVAGCRS